MTSHPGECVTSKLRDPVLDQAKLNVWYQVWRRVRVQVQNQVQNQARDQLQEELEHDQTSW